jgi:hypothetical protein
MLARETPAQLLLLLLLLLPLPALPAAAAARLVYAAAGAPNATVLPAGRPWRAIDRVPAAEMTAARFEREYYNRKRPVIVVGAHSAAALQGWDFDALVERCGGMELDLANHHLHFFDSLAPVERATVEAGLAARYNTSISAMRALRTARTTLREWAARYLRVPADGRAYDHFVDYLAPPLSVHSVPLARGGEPVAGAAGCAALAASVRPPHWLAAALLPMFQRLLEEQADDADAPPPPRTVDALRGYMNAFLFVAGAGSRSYPAHQHAVSNEVVMHMVRGRKHFVFWPPSEQARLYPLDPPGGGGGSGSRGRTENRGSFGRGDQVYLAEGVFLDTARQPRLAEVGLVGWEGIAERGDAAYVPCGTIHSIHNVDAILAVGTQFYGHPRCGVWDEGAGGWRVPEGFHDETLAQHRGKPLDQADERGDEDERDL